MLSLGFSGVRVFAEISISVKNIIQPEHFLRWEQFADKLFPENKFLAVCAYNKNYFSEQYISKITHVHPIEIDLISTRL